MELDLTIAVCAYNAAQRLPAVLEAMARQESAGITWELLIIDNNSKDTTSTVAEQLGRSLNLPLRVVHEPLPGLTNARRRAAQEARGRLLSYIDDDNLVEPDWARRCVEFLDAHPRCGVAGGRIDPIFEDPASRPPDFDARFAEALAVRNLGSQPLQLLPPQYDGPPGAGMTGRTALFKTVLIDIACRLSGPKGSKLSRGEDSEICLVAHHLGWELWYVPALRMGHVLPPGRLNSAYLERLISEGAQSSPWLDYLRGLVPRCSRFYYFRWWAFWVIASIKNALLARWRGPAHPHAQQMRFWASMFHYRAKGYWDVATTYPFKKFEATIADLASRAGPPPQSIASAGHLVG